MGGSVEWREELEDSEKNEEHETLDVKPPAGGYGRYRLVAPFLLVGGQ